MALSRMLKTELIAGSFASLIASRLMTSRCPDVGGSSCSTSRRLLTWAC